MTSLQRHGGGLPILGIALDRFAPPRETPASAVAVQLRAGTQARIAERLRKARNS